MSIPPSLGEDVRRVRRARGISHRSCHSDPQGGNCVEWAPGLVSGGGVVPVRDSKAVERGALLFPGRLAGVRGRCGGRRPAGWAEAVILPPRG
ncbi:DUF397 domain-containing protein [Streptomyces sp. AA1529]|uniref:DUF397 domain-containing protein n=1 Tax=Streptomyces sp. AA1529 TaxID=1203257 RepID=UPI000996EDA0